MRRETELTISDLQLEDLLKSMCRLSEFELSIVKWDQVLKDIRMDATKGLEMSVLNLFAQVKRIGDIQGLNVNLPSKPMCKAILDKIYPSGLKKMADERNGNTPFTY